jgi:uncharacterized protein CbrC (UPF0167 family)
VTTFADLGAPFPLFAAPIEDASDFAGPGRCSLCKSAAAVRFELGIGCDVMVGCPGCGLGRGLDADDATAGVCRGCGQSVPYPVDDEVTYCCYSCLRAGRAAITKDTEVGMLTWEHELTGVSHGKPGLKHRDFELVPLEGDWVGARLPIGSIRELLHTPAYLTIQGDQWLFCCGHPMVFIGQWSRQHFIDAAEDGDGRALFATVVDDVVPGLWEDELHDETGVYVFRCDTCGRKRAHWDIA